MTSMSDIRTIGLVDAATTFTSTLDLSSLEVRDFDNEREQGIAISQSTITFIPSRSRSKPSRKRVCAYTLPMLAMAPIVGGLKILYVIKGMVLGKSPFEKLTDELNSYVKRGDQADTLRYINEKLLPIIRSANLSNNSTNSLNFLVDLLSVEEMHPHLHEFLKGANFKITNGSTEFFDRWSQIAGTHKRRSSHPHMKHKSRGIAGAVTSDFHHWIDKQGFTRFQLEGHPLTGRFFGLLNMIHHTWDLLKYRRNLEQQGPFGTSLHTDDHPIELAIDLERFTRKRAEVLGSQS